MMADIFDPVIDHLGPAERRELRKLAADAQAEPGDLIPAIVGAYLILARDARAALNGDPISDIKARLSR